MLDPFIGFRVSDDGTCDPVFCDKLGRQYVLDPAGAEVYGNWVLRGTLQGPHMRRGFASNQEGDQGRTNSAA